MGTRTATKAAAFSDYVGLIRRGEGVNQARIGSVQAESSHACERGANEPMTRACPDVPGVAISTRQDRRKLGYLQPDHAAARFWLAGAPLTAKLPRAWHDRLEIWVNEDGFETFRTRPRSIEVLRASVVGKVAASAVGRTLNFYPAQIPEPSYRSCPAASIATIGIWAKCWAYAAP
jgi:hypothetical protein